MAVHFGSGTILRTDWLGAQTVRALIDGRSDAEIVELVEQIEAGAGVRADRLIYLLETKGAVSWESPPLERRWRSPRRLASLVASLAMGVVAPLVRLAPTSVLVWIFGIWPSTPIGRHIWRSSRTAIIDNLRASGYAERTDLWLLDAGRCCAAELSRNYLFMFVSVTLSPQRLRRLVQRLFDNESADEVATQLSKDGATVGVFLHGPLCAAAPNPLRTRSIELVRTVFGHSHGINVSERSGPLDRFFGDSSSATVDVATPLAGGALLRHLKAGRSVYIALDKVGGEIPAAEIEILGQSLVRNDGPAWLAVRAGRPLTLLTTHHSPAGVVISASPLLYPDLSLPGVQRVADLSKRLYRRAEEAVREHPEAWSCWSYLGLLKAKSAR